jgi:hypothetical protein
MIEGGREEGRKGDDRGREMIKGGRERVVSWRVLTSNGNHS